MMCDDVHVGLQANIGRHRFADRFSAAGDCGSAVHLIDANNRGVRVVHGGGRFDVLRVERSGKP
jgi:hypothetical protein